MDDGRTTTAADEDTRDGLRVRTSRSALDLDVELSLDDLAEITGLTSRNLRSYQQRQLLPPALRRGRRVVYTYEHVVRVRLVRALHDHGLTLRVIQDLVSRDAADSELARLGRDEVGAHLSRPRMVPMNPDSVDWYERHDPERMAQLRAARLVVDEGGRPVASAAGLGVTGALALRGYDLDVSGRLSLLAAEAAATVAPGVLAALRDDQDSPVSREEDRLLLAQMAATAFGDALRQYVSDAEDPPAAGPGTHGA